MKFAHIVNPVKVPESSDLYVAQPVTFRSMLSAKRFLKGRIDVELQAAFFSEDSDLVPDYFVRLPELERSVLDIGKFSKQRKLPLLKDILDRSVDNTDADYIIYTNVDIGLQPFFYKQVEQYLKQYDALVINRRTIAKCHDSSKPLSYFYLQRGKEHPGFDCFIFKRKDYKQYQLSDACIGANWIGRILICNLLCFAKNPFIEKNAFLTFHLGDDRSWKTIENIDYDEHNERQLVDLMKHLKGLGRIDSHDLLQRTYQEFVLKTQDPDFTRPKRVLVTQDVEQRKSEITSKTIHRQSLSMDYDDILPDIYMPSSSWEGTEGLALRQDPVFIVGHPRSGTSLLQSLIATQVTPVVFPETHFFSIVRSLLKVEEDRILKDCLKEILSFLKEKLVLTTKFEKYIVKSIQNDILSPKMLFEAIIFDQLVQKNNSGNDIKKIRWIEKTPDHAEFLDVIHRFYPSAKIIFVVRNPEKAIISRRKHFTWNNEAEWPIEKHVDRWLQTINAIQKFKQQHRDKIMTVKFEDAVENQFLTIESICDFLKTPFNFKKVRHYKTYSRQQSLPWETWKQDTNQGLSLKIALRKDSVLNKADKLFMKNALKSQLIEYGYI